MSGAHPEVLQALVSTNDCRTVGYGFDEFTLKAREIILSECGLKKGSVYFLEGGTQTNSVVIDRLLDKNDGVIATDTSHINVHEAGTIEANGHKILVLPNHDGKISASDIKIYIDEFYRDETYLHMVRPAMVYITFPTELGTIYTKRELTDISNVCREYSIPLYLDGARMAYGLAASGGDVKLKDIAELCDVFYIGGTKCGALFGEAVVTGNPDLLPRFESHIKLHGALFAKGRILSVQFSRLFTDQLYYRIGEKSVKLANSLKSALVSKGYRLFIDSPTNQQFFILPNDKISELKKTVSFDYWGPMGKTESAVRFVTDWTTTVEDIEEIISKL